MTLIKKKVVNWVFVLTLAVASLGTAAALQAYSGEQVVVPTSYYVVDGGGIDGECAVASSSCTGM